MAPASASAYHPAMSADFGSWTYGEFMAEIARLNTAIAAPATPPALKAKAEADLEALRAYVSEHATHFDDGWHPDA